MKYGQFVIIYRQCVCGKHCRSFIDDTIVQIIAVPGHTAHTYICRGPSMRVLENTDGYWDRRPGKYVDYYVCPSQLHSIAFTNVKDRIPHTDFEGYILI